MYTGCVGVQMHRIYTCKDYQVVFLVHVYIFFTVGSYMHDKSMSAKCIFISHPWDGSQFSKLKLEESTSSKKQEWGEEGESDTKSAIVTVLQSIVIMSIVTCSCVCKLD